MSRHRLDLKGFISEKHLKMIEKILELSNEDAHHFSVNYGDDYSVTFREFSWSDWDWNKFSMWFEHIRIEGGGGGFFGLPYVEITVSGFKEPKAEEKE